LITIARVENQQNQKTFSFRGDILKQVCTTALLLPIVLPHHAHFYELRPPVS